MSLRDDLKIYREAIPQGTREGGFFTVGDLYLAAVSTAGSVGTHAGGLSTKGDLYLGAVETASRRNDSKGN